MSTNIITKIVDFFIKLWNAIFHRTKTQRVIKDEDIALPAPVPEEQKKPASNFFTKEHYPNMPRYQPCEKCQAGSRRTSRTKGGANYNCRHHGEFFVAASKAARGYR